MDTTITPRVSVLMPVYNAAQYLREAIESILNQSFRDFEFLILNDGSTDESEAIILSYQDPRIIYLKNSVNQGLIYTLNKGLQAARGEYIARMDSDDISLPTRFEAQLAYLKDNPDVGICGTAYEYLGDLKGVVKLPTDPKEAFTHLSVSSCVGHPTVMIRKGVLDQYGLRYEDEYAYAADYAFWIKASQVTDIVSLPESLLRYRWHLSNMSLKDPSRTMATTKARTLWYQLILPHYPLNDQQREYLSELATSWEVHVAGKALHLAVLEKADAQQIDQEYYTKFKLVSWEYKAIKHFGLRGLLDCLSDGALRKKSPSKRIGLLVWYLQAKIRTLNYLLTQRKGKPTS